MHRSRVNASATGPRLFHTYPAKGRHVYLGDPNAALKRRAAPQTSSAKGCARYCEARMALNPGGGELSDHFVFVVALKSDPRAQLAVIGQAVLASP